MKTYNECLDEVSIKYGFNGWDKVEYDFAFSPAKPDIQTMYEEAALLYGEAKKQEGAKEMKEAMLKIWFESNAGRDMDRMDFTKAFKEDAL